MNYLRLLPLILIAFAVSSCNDQKETSETETVNSPNGNIIVQFDLNDEGRPFYSVVANSKTVIDTSYLGFEFKDLPAISSGLKITDVSKNSVDEAWDMPWGEQKSVNNNYNELNILLEETTEKPRKFNIIFRVFNDGVGFRFDFPKQENLNDVLLTGENTEFNLTGDHTTWWQPGDWDIYEHLYNESKFSEIDALAKKGHRDLAATYIPENAVNTPVTMKIDNGLYLSFHEADLTNYSDMTLKVDKENLSFVSELVGSERLNAKAKLTTPFKTPWRTIQIAEKPGDLIESKMILNLNDPNAIGEVDYFTPMKYVGIWWEMHIGKSTWDMEGSQDMNTWIDGETRGKSRHGATTANAKKYIDFAAENGIKGLLVEGWNTGWDKWISSADEREGLFDFMTPYADYNFDEVKGYAEAKGVEIIMHHETSSAPLTYEKQMDEAYDFMKRNNMNSVKTGYVGEIIPDGEYHHGQWMVNHYQKVLEEAAKKKIAVNAHEPIKGTGKRRTYPNAIAREGLRGQEFNAWSTDGGNPPNHLPTIAFTRMLAGPIDFTPGVFNIKFNEFKKENQVNTTLAQQLALYVVLYSPIQMAADLPEHYMKNGDIHPAFQFIKDVGVDWQQSKVLDGEIGDYVVIARQEKTTDNWFVGGVTNEDARTYSINFNFLDENETYTARLYKDGEDAHWDNNPESYQIEEMDITKASTLDIKMASGGGFAISLIKKE